MTSNDNLSSIDKRIKHKFGSRKGLFNYIKNKILFYFGFFNNTLVIDWSSVNRIVFVCKGNICRSAYAGVLARSQGVESLSFGLDTVGGGLANDRAILMAEKFDCDLTGHRTRTYENMSFTDSDLIVVMEPSQLKEVRTRTNNQYQYTLLGLWSREKLPYIHDPYSSTEEYFETCFNIIEDAVYAITSKFSRSRN